MCTNCFVIAHICPCPACPSLLWVSRWSASTLQPLLFSHPVVSTKSLTSAVLVMRNDAFPTPPYQPGLGLSYGWIYWKLILAQASLRSAAYRVSEKALGGKIRSWAIKRYLMWAPWLCGVPGFGSIRLRHHNPGDF